MPSMAAPNTPLPAAAQHGAPSATRCRDSGAATCVPGQGRHCPPRARSGGGAATNITYCMFYMHAQSIEHLVFRSYQCESHRTCDALSTRYTGQHCSHTMSTIMWKHAQMHACKSIAVVQTVGSLLRRYRAYLPPCMWRDICMHYIYVMETTLSSLGPVISPAQSPGMLPPRVRSEQGEEMSACTMLCASRAFAQHSLCVVHNIMHEAPLVCCYRIPVVYARARGCVCMRMLSQALTLTWQRALSFLHRLHTTSHHDLSIEMQESSIQTHIRMNFNFYSTHILSLHTVQNWNYTPSQFLYTHPLHRNPVCETGHEARRQNTP